MIISTLIRLVTGSQLKKRKLVDPLMYTCCYVEQPLKILEQSQQVK